MATLYDSASLALIPSGVKDGKAYSIKPTDGSGDFTFSRGTGTATRVNASGLIEKERSNQLLQSNTFSNAAWASTQASATSGQSGYDGSSDAWLLEKTGSSSSRITQSITKSGVYTFSAYAKANTSSKVAMYIGGVNVGPIWNLTNGTYGGTFAGTAPIVANIEAIGASGWYRVSAVVSGSITDVRLYPDPSDPTGTSIYIQDAQLEQGLVATDYIETTTAAVYEGITDNLPRLDYSGGASCPSLLLEPSRTNLITQSEYFGAWDAANSTQTLINDTNPVDGVAYEIESSVTGSGSRIYQNGSMIAGNDYSSSYLVKASANHPEYIGFACISNLTPDVLYNFATDSFEDFDIAGNAAKCESISMTNGWKLLKVPVHENVTNTRFNIYQGSKVGNALQGTTGQSYYLKFAQLEAGSYPTSYIPTYGTSASRAVDSCVKTGISSLIGQTEGTLFIEAEADEGGFRAFSISDGTTGNRITIAVDGFAMAFKVIPVGGGSVGTQLSQAYVSGNAKLAVTYTSGSYSFFVNGSKVNDAALGSFSAAFSKVAFDQANGGNAFAGDVKQALIFPTALTDAECIALTTL
jgi:hypothetical protein